jgi:hypothetical protein
MHPVLRLLGLALAISASPAAAQQEGNAGALLPACRLYVQQGIKGERLRLERGVCIGTVETVLLLHRPLRSAYRFCPPGQITLLEAVKTVVAFAETTKDDDRPFHEFALEAFQIKWPCKD